MILYPAPPPPDAAEGARATSLRRTAVVVAVLGIALPFAIGWLAWRHASTGGADPYDSGTYWSLAVLVALALGLAANTYWVVATVPFALTAYPLWNTPALADEANSPFGAVGIMFLMLFVPVLAGMTALGAYMRSAWGKTGRRVNR